MARDNWISRRVRRKRAPGTAAPNAPQPPGAVWLKLPARLVVSTVLNAPGDPAIPADVVSVAKLRCSRGAANRDKYATLTEMT